MHRGPGRILMTESAVGVSVAATRQKVGSWLNCGAAGPVPGKVNTPAGTNWARVIEVFGSARDDKLSHDDTALRACPCVVSARRAHTIPQLSSSLHVLRSSDARAQDKIHSLHWEFYAESGGTRLIAAMGALEPRRGRSVLSIHTGSRLV